MLVSSKLFPEATKSSTAHTLVLRHGTRLVLILLPKTYQVSNLLVHILRFLTIARNYLQRRAPFSALKLLQPLSLKLATSMSARTPQLRFIPQRGKQLP